MERWKRAMDDSGDKVVFNCPLNFEPLAVCDGTVSSDPDLEVWLIKTPADFNPESFTTHRLPLSGHKTQKVKVDGVRRLYHVTASSCTDAPYRALLPQGDKLVCAPPFHGFITISDSLGDSTAIHAIPDRPPVSIPEGLKLRYCPFGSVAPRSKREGNLTNLPTKKKSKKRKREVARE
ncbi:hypothetical protein GDO86_015523 [Hymenochirus boettgeri]|uniref:Uncharacterized protein n=1 Tax=Hymenochirus boettgeri TaxID=247094 RepID=A0A8T2K1C4_9PIPI|nr:hypothetical protein GDO86_015523 [Hymenochirus boettgeri]